MFQLETAVAFILSAYLNHSVSAEERTILTKCAGQTYYAARKHRCFKIDLFEGGFIVSYDKNNAGCQNAFSETRKN